MSLVRPDYIIEGKVDLITGKDNTVEIVDFKSEQKPDINTDIERIEHYRRQLNICLSRRTENRKQGFKDAFVLYRRRKLKS